VGKMANMVADECRNSLTVVGGFSRRLYKETPYDDPRKKDLGIIVEEDDDPRKKDLGIIVEEVAALESKVSKIVKIGNNE